MAGATRGKVEPLSVEAQVRIKAAEAVVASAADTPAEKEAALLGLGDLSHPALLEVVRKAMKDSSPEVKQAALQLLADLDSPEVPALAAQGLKDSDPLVRQTAARALGATDGPGVAEALGIALQDAEEGVRDAGLDELQKKSESTQVAAMSAVIRSPNLDAAKKAVDFFEQMRSHAGVDALLSDLDDKRAEVRELLNDALENLIGKRFASQAEADEFWEKNRSRYDDDLTEATP